MFSDISLPRQDKNMTESKKNKQTNSKLCPNIVKKFSFRLEKYNNSYTVQE